MNAQDYRNPDMTVCFMFHPFGETTLTEVLHNIELVRLRTIPQAAHIYVNPVYDALLQRTPWLERISRVSAKRRWPSIGTATRPACGSLAKCRSKSTKARNPPNVCPTTRQHRSPGLQTRKVYPLGGPECTCATYGNLEIVLSDDASPDQTFDIMREERTVTTGQS